jgi:hypothetical protein
VSGQPNRQQDTEIFGAVLGVACCQIRQWAAEMVKSQDYTLEQNYCRQRNGPPETAQHPEHRQGHDAASKEEPDRGVKDLDPG